MHIIETVHKHRIKEVKEENGMERRRREWTLARQRTLQLPSAMAEARMDIRLR
jgi:hypothetical protein